MSDYKRLTKQAGWHKDIDLKYELGYSYIYQRLSELENKIEQGTLIELPCEVGDLVYFVSKKNGIQFSTINEIKIHIDFTGIVGIEVRDDDYKWHTVNNRTVLLDEEEAEKRLKELQE